MHLLVSLWAGGSDLTFPKLVHYRSNFSNIIDFNQSLLYLQIFPECWGRYYHWPHFGHVLTPVPIELKKWGLDSFTLWSVQFSPSVVSDSATPWTAACQASLSITNSQSLLKLISIESLMPSNYLILCCPLLLPPSNFPSIRVFSNESALCIRWPKY